MNKPILAACAGVTFGLFLGGLLMGGFGSRSCHRQVETRAPIRVVETRPQMTTRVVFQSTVIRQNGGVIHTETRQQISNVGPEEALDTLSNAQTAYVTGDYRGAIAIAKTGMSDSPVRANRIIGAAACNLKDLPQIEQAYRRLDGPSRQYVVYVCQRSGVTFSGNRFRLSE